MKNRKGIFYDGGQRWKKLKGLILLAIVLFFIPLWIVTYAFLYSPFKKANYFNQAPINLAINNIHTHNTPAIGAGTFVTIDTSSYNKPYIKRFGEGRKLIILTFDDGPDLRYTYQILWVLRKEHVPATFFEIGEDMYKYPQVGKAILAQGSDIGLHTFTHPHDTNQHFKPIDFIRELDFSEKIFAHNFGYKTLLFRVPYLATEDNFSFYALQFVQEANKRGLTISDPTADSEDWHYTHDPNMVTKLSTYVDSQSVVLLMHDGGGDRNATVQSLPKIIKYYKDRNYQFLTMSQYAQEFGLPYKEQLALQDKLFIPLAVWLYDFYKQSPHIITDGFLLGIMVVIAHSVLLVFLAIRQSIRVKKTRQSPYRELISVVIPIYNEERAIEGVVKSVLKSSYRNIEIILVNDGSTDNTINSIIPLLSDQRVKLFSKEKGGKYSALNYGFEKASGQFVVCIDADTKITSTAIEELIDRFYDSKVGAVAGTVLVGNKTNLISRLQSLEYIINQGIEKKAFDLFDAVTVVPGAVGAWRRNLVKKLGGFSPSTVTEDFELTLALIKNGYKVSFCEEAIAYTEAPMRLDQLVQQRSRWNFGNLQVYFKYRNLLFNRRHRAIGMFILPRALFVQIPTILFSPFVDLFIVLNLLFGFRQLTILFLILYLLIQFVLAITACIMMKRDIKEAIYVPILRFSYFQLMYLVFYSTIFQAIKGEIFSWVKTKHAGLNVQVT